MTRHIIIVPNFYFIKQVILSLKQIMYMYTYNVNTRGKIFKKTNNMLRRHKKKNIIERQEVLLIGIWNNEVTKLPSIYRNKQHGILVMTFDTGWS